MTVPATIDVEVAPEARSDGHRLIATRGIRGFVDGAVSVVLAAYLTLLGYSGVEVGVVVTAMMLGSAALTLATGTYGHRFRRRTVLVVGAVLMIGTGVTYASTTVLIVLIVVGAIGTMNPSSGDVSVFLPMEQSLLPATAPDSERTALFARYAFTGSILGAVGSLAAGVPDWVARHTSLAREQTLRGVFIAYAIAGVGALVIYRSLSPAIEPATDAGKPQPLGESRPIVYRLAAVFSLDALGGGFTVQSLLALWLYRRFDLSVGAAGALLFWTGACSAFSAFVAARIAKKIGLIRTMVFTHLPAQLLLIAAALMPNLTLAVVCLVARSLLSAMDAPLRSSYVMAVVTPGERAAAASVTNVPRSLAAALPPIAAGWMLDHSTVGWPLIIAGVTKIAYDLLLLRMFRHIRPPEER
ncbi:MAG: major facilitator superfamily 1 [Ilumatobacteraceae bacterium]|nr:major facilitator superfamily 1 [Ilumatobacteraceae bacterium]